MLTHKQKWKKVISLQGLQEVTYTDGDKKKKMRKEENSCLTHDSI